MILFKKVIEDFQFKKLLKMSSEIKIKILKIFLKNALTKNHKKIIQLS